MIYVSHTICRKVKIHHIFNKFLRKSRRLLDNVEKCGRIRQAKDDIIAWSMRLACWINKATNTH